MVEDRKGKIAEWTAKGAEWCAKQLWEARKANHRTAEHKRQWKNEAMRAWAQQNVDVHVLERANKNMVEVLEKNGIRPIPLRVTYLDRNCADCEYGPEWGSDEFNCWNCGEVYGGRPHWEEEKEWTRSISFYTYCIDGEYLSGITSQFDEVDGYFLKKIVDERTGEVIGEWEIPEEE